ncbi:hypothetical protein TRVL_04030 [Trypanosoma vivax]|nr:hypothetical protein TRVL_04030 [Trypanosoma vivax]
MAMEDFRRALLPNRGTSLFSKSNAWMVDVVRTCVQHSVLCHPPEVIPSVARSAREWRLFLGCGSNEDFKGHAEEEILLAVPAAQRNLVGAAHISCSESKSPIANSLPPSDLYVARTGVGGGAGNKDPCPVVKETVPASAMHFGSPFGRFDFHGHSYTAPCPSARNATDDHATIFRSSEGVDTGQESDKAKSRVTRLSGVCQPHFTAQQLMGAASETAAASCGMNSVIEQDQELDVLVRSRAAALRTKIASALQMVQSGAPECVEILHSLEARVDAAERQFDASNHEIKPQELVDEALKVEVEALERVVKNLVNTVAEAERRHESEGPDAPFYAEELHLMKLLRHAVDGMTV